MDIEFIQNLLEKFYISNKTYIKHNLKKNTKNQLYNFLFYQSRSYYILFFY